MIRRAGPRRSGRDRRWTILGGLLLIFGSTKAEFGVFMSSRVVLTALPPSAAARLPAYELRHSGLQYGCTGRASQAIVGPLLSRSKFFAVNRFAEAVWGPHTESRVIGAGKRRKRGRRSQERASRSAPAFPRWHGAMALRVGCSRRGDTSLQRRRSWPDRYRSARPNGSVRCSPSMPMHSTTAARPEFAAISAVAQHHNEISNLLSTAPERFGPICRRKPSGGVDVRPWCLGFYAAMTLRLTT